MNASRPRKKLYPPLDARRSGHLKVSDIHEVYWEESGNPNGVPVIALHGGPGGGSSPEMRRFFDPRRYRIIIADQRGCGKSRPFSELEGNDTWALIDDIETLRLHLDIDKWVVFGGSWGSTLSLAYAVTHPERTLALVLRGIFLLRRSEIQWFYQQGASHLFPDAFQRYIAPIPEDERDDLVSAFHKRLISDNGPERRQAARAWAQWEGETLSIQGPRVRPPRFEEDDFVDAFARIECHYFVNGGFFPEDGWLLKQVEQKLSDTPGIIVQGRYDIVTPLVSAWDLSQAWPKAILKIIPDAGHSSLEPGIVDELVRACDRYADMFG